MLRNIVLSNFKCLVNAELEGLTKLNILIGSNSSGKSSIFQGLMLVKTMWDEGIRPEEALSHLGLGQVRDVVFKRDPSNAAKIVIGFDLDDYERNRIVELAVEEPVFDLFASSRIGYSLQFSHADARLEVLCGGSSLFEVSTREPGKVAKPLRSELNVSLNWPYPKFGGPPTIVATLYGIGEILRDRFTNRLRHLGALRGSTRLGSQIPDTRPKYVDSRGENVEGILGFMRDDPEDRPVYDKIAYWASEFGLEDVVERTIDGPLWMTTGKDSLLDVDVSRVNTGFGTNQLLSAIVLCFDSRPLSTIMIEQPEIHLHPESQSKLADLFLDVVEYGNQLILETHSEHLLMRLQRYVAEGKLSLKDIAVFFVEKTRSGSEVRKLIMERDGRIPEGLPGFFEADFDELIALLKAREKP